MALTKTKKGVVTKEIEGLLGGAQSAVFVNFHGLTANDTVQFRKSLRDSGVGLKVAKKTLLSRALGVKGVSGDMPVLPGEIALAYGDDLIAPAREVYAFAQTHKEHVQIVGGVFENRYMSQAEMLSVATIPSREVLLSKIAFLLKSPIQRLAIAVSEVSKQKA